MTQPHVYISDLRFHVHLNPETEGDGWDIRMGKTSTAWTEKHVCSCHIGLFDLMNFF
jgi:hypothetical protein